MTSPESPLKHSPTCVSATHPAVVSRAPMKHCNTLLRERGQGGRHEAMHQAQVYKCMVASRGNARVGKYGAIARWHHSIRILQHFIPCTCRFPLDKRVAKLPNASHRSVIARSASRHLSATTRGRHKQQQRTCHNSSRGAWDHLGFETFDEECSLRDLLRMNNESITYLNEYMALCKFIRSKRCCLPCLQY